MQGGWQPPPGGGGGYGPPGGGGGYGAPPPGGGGPPMGGPPGYGQAPPAQGFAPNPYGGAPQGQQFGGGGMLTPQYGNYEFNEYENSIIDKTASRAKLWGIISTTVGALQVVGSCGMVANPSLGTWLPTGIIAIVVGVTFIGAGNSLKAVVTTQGNDLMHLMQAMQKMSSAFIIEIICAIVGFALAVLGLLLVLFVFAAVAASQ